MECNPRFVIVPDTALTKGAKGDKGDKGDDASLSLPLSSDDVQYNAQTLTAVLDQLLYVGLLINSFSAGVYNFEKGVVLTTTQLSWDYNKAVESQTITGPGVTPPSLILSDRSKLVTLLSVSTNTVITLTADDETSDTNPAKTASLTLQFMNKIYYGKAVLATVNSAFILALTSELKADRTKSFSLSTGSGEYLWFAIPTAYGTASFKTNGFDGGFYLHSTLSFTNASGHTENYYIYRSNNENLGLTSVEVL